ncbi:conserved hypothetical protein [Vibrio crassostreae]|nr:conserved hypothetical protein [Vibrio crassostreae]CAK2276371.1 conserved hypothetical protein [Vibrio crassostreae]CAK2412507.1 conserved hypothetical protein [Vibrio crassostreae]CAK2646936.1 conserved hypothetical protein [Vibrio crassostreae]
MIYAWAKFHHSHRVLGRAVNILVLILAAISIGLATLSENVVVLGIALIMALFCCLCFLVFALSDRLRHSMV